MTETVVDIHVLPHSQSEDTINAMIMNALQLGFRNATRKYSSSDSDPGDDLAPDDRISLTVTVEYEEAEYDTDTSVRTELEDMLADAPIDVEATETNHKAHPTRALPAPGSE